MSLEAIEKVTEVERKNKERRAAAETEAKQMLASAQRDGLALLEQMRAEEAAKGAELLRQAEERAAQRSEQIAASAEAEGRRPAPGGGGSVTGSRRVYCRKDSGGLIWPL